MNYTGKYHLPQWEETDRIMRTDFNNAMAAIEAGMAGNAGNAEDLRSRLLPMGRDAYRAAVQQRVHHGTGGASETMWINSLSSPEDAGNNGDGWTGSYGLLLGERALPTEEGIRATAENTAQINTYHFSNRNKSEVVFTSDGYGMLEKIRLTSTIYSNRASTEFSFTITCTRLDKLETVQTAGPFTTVSYDNTKYPTWYTVNFRLDPGVTYRLEYSVPEGSGFQGEHAFVLNDPDYSDPQPALSFATRPMPEIISKSVTPPVGYTGAAGLLRWKGDGTVTMSLNGAALVPISEREAINAVGQSCLEREYAIDQLPEETLILTLQMVKGEGDLWIYDYGLIWQ